LLDFAGDHHEGLETFIFLFNAPGTIIAAFLEGHAVLAAECRDVLDELKVAIFTKPSAVLPRAAAHIRQNLDHDYTIPELAIYE
jgi:hypothetical protein